MLVKVGRGVTATQLHVDREGSGEPILWITGLAISSEVFSPVIGRYAAGFDCIRYDSRGAGRSYVPWRPTSIPELAADAVHLLDALDIGSAHVYGLSMGGMVAQEVALRFPDRVRALVLGGTTHGGPQAALPSPAIAVALASRGTPAARRAELAGRALFTPSFREREPERVRRYLGHLGRHRASARGLVSHLAAAAYHDTRARLGRITAPTLVMHGAQDELTPPANAQLLAQAIPAARLALVPDAGHLYLLEQPDVSHALFTDWLAAISPVSPGRPLAGLRATGEPLTRALGLQVGMLRSVRSLYASPVRRRPPDQEE